MRLFRWILFAQLILGSSVLAQQDPIPPLPSITAPASGEYLPGKFVWADLFSSDVEASRRFYEQVFGWEWRLISKSPESYGIFYLDGRPIAGLALRASPDDEHAYGRWIHYISVEDVSATERAIGERKGRILLGHRSVADRGEFAILADVHEALFGIIHSSSGDPADYRSTFGEWIWRELFTRDPGEAIRFYTELFAYQSETDKRFPEIMKYLLKSDGYLRAGIGSLSAESDTAPTWLGYLRVDDIDAALKRTLAHGGEVLLEPREEIVDGGLAIVTDPTGATIGLLHWDYDDEGEMQP